MIGTGKCGSLFGTNLKLNMTIMHRSKPESKFLFNPGEVFIQTIIVDRVPERVLYGLVNNGGGTKGTRPEYPPCKIFSQTARYTNISGVSGGVGGVAADT